MQTHTHMQTIYNIIYITFSILRFVPNSLQVHLVKIKKQDFAPVIHHKNVNTKYKWLPSYTHPHPHTHTHPNTHTHMIIHTHI